MNALKIDFSDGLRLNSGAIFIDRDGVVIEDTNYICSPESVRIERGAIRIFQAAKRYRMKVIIVTNQSGIGRGYYSWGDYLRVTSRMLEMLDYPNELVAIYANSLVKCSEETICWRKPSPGMLTAAAKELGIELGMSVLIGDRLSDMQAGYRAGIKKLVHMQTGHGERERKEVCKFKKYLVDQVDLMLSDDLTNLDFEKLLGESN